MLPVPDFYKDKKQENDFNLIGKVKVKLLIVFSCMLFGLITAQLVFANSLATDGQKLQAIHEQIEKLETENTKLKVEIAQNSSLSSLSQKAQESGFGKPSKVITP